MASYRAPGTPPRRHRLPQGDKRRQKRNPHVAVASPLICAHTPHPTPLSLPLLLYSNFIDVKSEEETLVPRAREPESASDLISGTRWPKAVAKKIILSSVAIFSNV